MISDRIILTDHRYDKGTYLTLKINNNILS